MKSHHILSLLILIFTFDGLSALSASPEIILSLRSRVVEAPDSVLAELDMMETEKAPVLPHFQIDLLRASAYNEKRMFTLVERYAEKTLSSDSIGLHPKEKLQALTLLSVAQAYYGNYQGSIRSSIEAMSLARKEGNQATEYNILTTMAKTSFTMGDRKRGYKYVNRIISEGKESEDIRVLANVSAAYGVKIVELYADDRFDEGLAEGKRRLDLIDRIEEIGGAPEGFTDQQRAYAYARIASCAQRLGHTGEAREAYGKFMATDYASNPMGRVYIMDYLLDSQQWRKVLDFTSPLYPMFEESDTINNDYLSLLISDGRAQAGLGNYREGYDLIQRASAIQDSLYMREKTTHAQELASIFALNEKELALANEKAISQRQHIMMLTSCGIAILILIILILVWRAYLLSEKRQLIAAKRIDELVAQQSLSPEATPEDQNDYSLFAEMQSKIVAGALFKNPSFNRDNIAEATGLSRGKVTHLISQFAEMTPNEYINRLRVEYSAKLIKEHP